MFVQCYNRQPLDSDSYNKPFHIDLIIAHVIVFFYNV